MKKVSLALMAILFVFIIACGKMEKGESKMQFQVSPDNLTAFELIKTIYSDEQLSDIYQLNEGLDGLNEHYPIECLRYNEITDSYYATFLSPEKLVYLGFQSDGKMWMKDMAHISPSKAYFDKLDIGQSLDDVQKLDPEANYYFLKTGRTDAPTTSTHYTEDGWIIVIEYNTQYCISTIRAEQL